MTESAAANPSAEEHGKPLILMGYWLGPYAPGWPDPRNFVDPSWDVDERTQIVNYLERGMAVRYYMGESECRFCGQFVGSGEYSDGTVVWPEGLAHYVAEHAVRLPAAFVDHARRATEALENRPVDQTWWEQQVGIIESTDEPTSAS